MTRTKDLPVVESVTVYPYGLVVSREVAIEYGLVEPTEAEAARLAAERADAERAAALRRRVVVEEWLAAYRKAGTPAERAVLSLHQPDSHLGVLVCRGCVQGDYEQVWNADWPCATGRLFGL